MENTVYIGCSHDKLLKRTRVKKELQQGGANGSKTSGERVFFVFDFRLLFVSRGMFVVKVIHVEGTVVR